MEKYRRALRFLRNYGPKLTLERLATGAAMGLFRSGFHKWTSPSLHDLSNAGLSSHFSAIELLNHYFADQGQEFLIEYQILCDKLSEHRKNISFPPGYRTDPEACLLLYSLVRARRPATVLETGVADGNSSFFILNAMMKNNFGTLYSVDIARNVGSLVQEPEKVRWRLHFLNDLNPRKGFESLVNRLPQVDIFVHDSDHVYQWQYFEFNTVRHKLVPTSILLADDADWSFAFLDFCNDIGVKPILLIQKRNVFGIALLTPPRETSAETVSSRSGS